MTSLVLAAALAIQQPPIPPREFRGAWVATVDNIDWPSRKGLSTQAARQELLDLIERCHELKLNALVFQVRPMADALYESRSEPWSEFLTGVQGKAPNPKWDPLAFAVEHCHARGMELHAWFNPYRAWHSAAKSPASRAHVSRSHPELVRTYGKQKWLDPGDPRVRDLTMRSILDVVRRYDIDGVHIDDYFYPYPIKGTPFPDQATYKKYGKGLSRADWRRQSVDQFVQRMYRDVRKLKPWVKVGISPFGIYRPNVPRGIEAGLDQYADLYADPKRWLKNGWLDYVAPQLYWAIDPPAQSFPILFEWWDAANANKRHLWPGLATYKIIEGPKWETGEISDQIDLTREFGGNGHIHFSAKYLVRNTKGLSDSLAQGVYAKRALVPPTSWIKSTAPKAPKLRGHSSNRTAEGTVEFEIDWQSGSPDTRDYVVSWRLGSMWSDWEVQRSALRRFIGRDDGAGLPLEFVIYARDRTGNLSEPLTVRLPQY